MLSGLLNAFKQFADQLGLSEPTMIQSTAHLIPQKKTSIIETNPEIDSLYDVIAAKGSDGQEAAERLFQPFYKAISEQAWLNDIVINNFFSALENTYQDQKVACILSLHFMAKQFQRYIDSLSINGRAKDEKIKLLNANLILWPICENSHWYLLLITKMTSGYEILCLDGWNNTTTHQTIYPKAITLLKKLYENTKLSELTVTEYSPFIPNQDNGYDCGVVICQVAKLVCEEKIIITEEQKKSYTDFRVEIGRAIAPIPEALFYNFGRALKTPKNYTPMLEVKKLEPATEVETKEVAIKKDEPTPEVETTKDEPLTEEIKTKLGC